MILRGMEMKNESWRDRNGRRGPKATMEAEDTEINGVLSLLACLMMLSDYTREGNL